MQVRELPTATWTMCNGIGVGAGDVDAGRVAETAADGDKDGVTEADEVVERDGEGVTVAVVDRVALGVGNGACHCTNPAETTVSLSPILFLCP
jgi:hypothetical protein